jgi:hypothetical protein
MVPFPLAVFVYGPSHLDRLDHKPSVSFTFVCRHGFTSFAWWLISMRRPNDWRRPRIHVPAHFSINEL